MPDQVTSLLPPGAGRFQDFIWPDPLEYLQPGIGCTFRSRTGGGAEMPGQTLVFAGGVPGGAPNVALGQPFVSLPCDVANAGTQRLFYPGFPVTLRTSRSPIDGRTDDCAVYRFVLTWAPSFVALGAGGELGFQLSQYNGGAGQRIIGDVTPGIGINLSDGNTVTLIVRGPNGLVSTVLPGVVSPFLCVFDLRFFSATATVDAYWTLRVNGALVPLSAINSNWGAPGTNLPPAAVSGSSCGFVPSLVSSAQNSNALNVQLFELIAAPTELMTL